MPHNANSRRAAAVVPLILFGDYGRTVEGYMPAEEDLALARPAQARHEWVPVAGPHLRATRSRDRRSKTGIVGISLSVGATGKRYVVVNLGSTNRKFNITSLGSSEAWRRAVALRRAHLEKLALANAAIIAARLRATEAPLPAAVSTGSRPRACRGATGPVFVLGSRAPFVAKPRQKGAS